MKPHYINGKTGISFFLVCEKLNLHRSLAISVVRHELTFFLRAKLEWIFFIIVYFT